MDKKYGRGILLKDAYIHICDALDSIVKSGKKHDGLSIYEDHDGDITLNCTSLKLCEAIYVSLKELGRECLFKSPRSIYRFIPYYIYKEYVREGYIKGVGWLFKARILTQNNRIYILKRKSFKVG